MVTNKEIDIYNYCEERWNFHEAQDRGYYPSKHDILVFNETSDHFGITVGEVEATFGKVSKIKAEEIVSGLSKCQIKNLMENILTNNKDFPWSK